MRAIWANDEAPGVGTPKPRSYGDILLLKGAELNSARGVKQAEHGAFPVARSDHDFAAHLVG